MSAVTAVPIRPIARGSRAQIVDRARRCCWPPAPASPGGARAACSVITLESGVRYRVVREGTGPAITTARRDRPALQAARNSLDGAGHPGQRRRRGQPFVATTADVYPPASAKALQQMRAGGRYLHLAAARHAMSAGRSPPGAPFTANDTLVFEIEVLQIAAGQASALQLQRMQQMQQRCSSRCRASRRRRPAGRGDPPGGAAPRAARAAPPSSGQAPLATAAQLRRRGSQPRSRSRRFVCAWQSGAWRRRSAAAAAASASASGFGRAPPRLRRRPRRRRTSARARS